MRWAGHVAHRGGAVHEGFWWGIIGIILKWIVSGCMNWIDLA